MAGKNDMSNALSDIQIKTVERWADYIIGQLYIPEQGQREWLKRQIANCASDVAGENSSRLNKTDSKSLIVSVELEYHFGGTVCYKMETHNQPFSLIKIALQEFQNTINLELKDETLCDTMAKECPFINKTAA